MVFCLWWLQLIYISIEDLKKMNMQLCARYNMYLELLHCHTKALNDLSGVVWEYLCFKLYLREDSRV